LTLGVDYRFTDQLVMGGAFAYNYTDTLMDKDAGNMRSNIYRAQIFGGREHAEARRSADDHGPGAEEALRPQVFRPAGLVAGGFISLLRPTSVPGSPAPPQGRI